MCARVRGPPGILLLSALPFLASRHYADPRFLLGSNSTLNPSAPHPAPSSVTVTAQVTGTVALLRSLPWASAGSNSRRGPAP